jgi:hypothetical protein
MYPSLAIAITSISSIRDPLRNRGVCGSPVLSVFEKRNVLRAYSEKESSLGFGNDDGASLAGKESAIVLSSIFSRFAFELAGFTTRSSGSLPGFFAFRFSSVVLLRTIVLTPVLGRRLKSRIRLS